VYGDDANYPDQGWARRGGSDSARATDVLVGIILWHKAQDGQACGGVCHFVRGSGDQDRPEWQVETLDPLTISPSVLCDGKYGCGGTHGFVRLGKWTPA
jgi:hypothetical protein